MRVAEKLDWKGLNSCSKGIINYAHSFKCCSYFLLHTHYNCFHKPIDILRWVHTCNVTAYRNAITLQVTDTIRSYDLNFHPVPHGVTVSCKCYTMGFPVHYGSQKHHECKEGEMNGWWWHVTLHVQTCSGHNRIIPLMRRPNTVSSTNMPVMLLCNQLLIHYGVTSPVHTVMILCYSTR
jgi:hypothetical protein